MSKYKWVLAIDPSGSFTEGKGTTGYCLLHIPDQTIVELGTLQAKDFTAKEAYWQAHLNLIERIRKGKHGRVRNSLVVVVEDYLLYYGKALGQANSRMETPKLLGIIQHGCFYMKQPIEMQLASTVKRPITDEVLVQKGLVKLKGARYDVNEHIRDSIRHAVYYAEKFYNKEVTRICKK